MIVEIIWHPTKPTQFQLQHVQCQYCNIGIGLIGLIQAQANVPPQPQEMTCSFQTQFAGQSVMIQQLQQATFLLCKNIARIAKLPYLKSEL